MAARLRPGTNAEHPLFIESGSKARDCGIPEARAPRSRAMDRRRQGAEPTETATAVRPGSGIIKRRLCDFADVRRRRGEVEFRRWFAGQIRHAISIARQMPLCAFDNDFPSSSNRFSKWPNAFCAFFNSSVARSCPFAYSYILKTIWIDCSVTIKVFGETGYTRRLLSQSLSSAFSTASM